MVSFSLKWSFGLDARAEFGRILACVVVALVASTLPLASQDHPVLLDIGSGSLSPTDKFSAVLSFRGSAGFVLSHRNALAVDYTWQNRKSSRSGDLGQYTRQFLGLAWHHAFRDAFYDDETKQQQYLLKLSAGLLVRGVSRTTSVNLANAPFVGVALAIRYPLSRHFAVAGTIEDDMAFIPRQTINTTSVGGELEHNFGLFIVAQWRP